MTKWGLLFGSIVKCGAFHRNLSSKALLLAGLSIILPFFTCGYAPQGYISNRTLKYGLRTIAAMSCLGNGYSGNHLIKTKTAGQISLYILAIAFPSFITTIPMTNIKICVILIGKYFYMCYYIIVRREHYMKSYSSREVIKMLKADGWYEVNVFGHHQYKHPTKKGRTTVKHPDKNIPLPTLKRIEQQSGLSFK